MNISRFLAYLKRDGWLLAGLFLCVAMSLLLASQEGVSGTSDDQLSRILSEIAGAGQVEVCVYYEDAAPCGAVIVAQGAGDVAVQLRLTSAISALLGLDVNRIAVYPRQGGV